MDFWHNRESKHCAQSSKVIERILCSDLTHQIVMDIFLSASFAFESTFFSDLSEYFLRKKLKNSKKNHSISFYIIEELID